MPRPRRCVFALAIVSAVTGCLGPPPGPVVTSRCRQNPATACVWCEATYALRADGQPDAPAIYECQVPENGQLGFYREKDGTLVATAPGYKQPLPPGEYRWEVVKGSLAPWRERAKLRLHQDVTETVDFTKAALIVAGIVVVVGGLLGLLLWGEKTGAVGVQLHQ